MKCFLLFFFIFPGITELFALMPEMITQRYTTDDGLSHNQVNCTLKDSDGWVWFGTWYGLCRFDGVKFKEYNNRDEYVTDIPPRKIQMILEDRAKNLWIKTVDHKLYLFNKRQEAFHSVFNELKTNFSVSSQIIKIQKTGDGELLLLTKEKDLLKAVSNREGEIELELLHNSTSTAGPTRLKNNILCETTGYINWIGLDYKLLSFRKGERLLQRPGDFITQKLGREEISRLTCATEDENYLWVGDESGRVWRIDCTTGDVDQYIVSEKGKKITRIVVNGKYIYAGLAGEGMILYDFWEKKAKALPVTVKGERIVNLFFDSYDKLWIEEQGEILRYYDPLNFREKEFRFQPSRVQKGFTFQDGRETGFYLLTPAGNVCRFNRGTLTMEALNQSLEAQREGQLPFFDIMLDQDRILWLSSVNAGVYRIIFPRRQFAWFMPAEGKIWTDEALHSNGVKAMLQTRNGDVWLGTRSGEVFRLDRDKRIKQVFYDGNFRIGNVYHIMEDRNGNLWFSTKGDGLVKAVPDRQSPGKFRFSRYLYDEQNSASISGNDVYCSFQDSRGRVWVGLFGGGLNLVEGDDTHLTFRHKYNCFQDYPMYGLYAEVRNITEDREGRIWVGTTDGLFSFDGNFDAPEDIHFETYRKDMPFSNIADNDIYALFRGKDSCIWVGVFGGGLNRLDGYDSVSGIPSFTSYGLKEGLATDVILSITGDNTDNLWLGTENGLTRFHIPTESFRNFDKYDGWPDTKLEEESILTCESGEIWVGCAAGFLTFRPENLTTYNPVYKTYIVDFKVSNQDIRSFKDRPIIRQSIKDTKSLTLDYYQSMFTIEFAALNYYNQNRINYRYLLEGYEKEWHLSGKNRIASYINVPPGNYVFKVLALDEAAYGPPSERTLKITILPPWWRTDWAYASYALLAVLLAIVIMRFVLFMVRIRNDIYINQKLAELKIKFFTNISHELRTPLTLIQGPIQELKEKEPLSDKGYRYLQLMEKSTDHMLQLVNQILDFRKIENGKMRLHISQIDLKEVVVSLYQEFRIMAEEKEVGYNLQIEEENLPLWADKEKLETAVRNILSNAFKFTPTGGSIFLSAGYTLDKKHYFVRIEDTGVGIPQNKLSEIFERFVQGDHTQNQGYQGTGIGLALAKEIVNLHHGQISVESKLQKGSVFTIDLLPGKAHFKEEEVDFYVGDLVPGADTGTEMEEEESGEYKDTSLPVMLVVEDNKDLCNLIKMQLDDKFRVHIAANGVEGLKKVHLYHPDIVVTDQMMPEMDGLEMLQQIRKDFQISHIPVIILTAKNDDEAKTKAISMGANAYITKPFSKDYLLARIEQLLGERKLFREKVWKSNDEETDAGTDYEQYLVKKDRELLDKIHQVIEANLDNSDFNIDTIASTIGLSRSAFFKKLKSLTGLAPVDLVKEVRLNKSVELIRNTDMTITEIAFAVGFKDSGYYGKCFRKKYRQTPREFMAESRKA